MTWASDVGTWGSRREKRDGMPNQVTTPSMPRQESCGVDGDGDGMAARQSASAAGVAADVLYGTASLHKVGTGCLDSFAGVHRV